MVIRTSLNLCLIFVGIMLIAGCGGEAASSPATAPAMAIPTDTPTTAPLATPTETPVPTPTHTPRPTVQVYLEWGVDGVRPSDSDDVDSIVMDVMNEDGIISGYGNEQGVTIRYDPLLITVEEIQQIFRRIGHPVVITE